MDDVETVKITHSLENGAHDLCDLVLTKGLLRGYAVLQQLS
jgi:hypothetical protein